MEGEDTGGNGMPTFGRRLRFENDYRRLRPAERLLFLATRDEFRDALLRWEAQGCRPNVPPCPDHLQVQDVKGHAGIWEITWEKHNGRATWEFGDQIFPGLVHIIWRRVGGHDIYNDP